MLPGARHDKSLIQVEGLSMPAIAATCPSRDRRHPLLLPVAGPADLAGFRGLIQGIGRLAPPLRGSRKFNNWPRAPSPVGGYAAFRKQLAKALHLNRAIDMKPIGSDLRSLLLAGWWVAIAISAMAQDALPDGQPELR
jgi:hypothetical protein